MTKRIVCLRKMAQEKKINKKFYITTIPFGLKLWTAVHRVFHGFVFKLREKATKNKIETSSVIDNSIVIFYKNESS